MNQNISDKIKHQGFVCYSLVSVKIRNNSMSYTSLATQHRIFPIIASYGLFVYKSNRIFQSGLLSAPKILLFILKLNIYIQHLTKSNIVSPNTILHPLDSPWNCTRILIFFNKQLRVCFSLITCKITFL